MPADRPTPSPTLASQLRAIVATRRLSAVVGLSYGSGLPLGVLLFLVPAWLKAEGVDTKTIGVLAFAQVPYSLKFLWAPLVDRWTPGFGRRRGWIAATQLVLAGVTFVLASLATTPTIGAVAALSFLMAVASATQDIAYDAYAVDALEPDEQGVAIGARVAMYRTAMFLGGNAAISAAPLLGWTATLGILAANYLLLLPFTLAYAPEPAKAAPPPPSLREAVWDPLVGLLRVDRALEIATFVVLYKLADNLAGALVRPFLVESGYDMTDIGLVTGGLGIVSTIAGTLLGGALTTRLGVARALWLFGFLQAASNLGYAFLATLPGPSSIALYVATVVESSTSGLGTGAFGVLLMRLTDKRFSATQYALLSSLFALGRTFSGPVAGTLVDAIGWRDFFLLTVPSAIPGLLFLHRFAPFGSRELAAFSSGEVAVHAPVSTRKVAGFMAAGGLGGGAFAAAGTLVLGALKVARSDKVPFAEAWARVVDGWAAFGPGSAAFQSQVVDVVSVVAFALAFSFIGGAVAAARTEKVGAR